MKKSTRSMRLRICRAVAPMIAGTTIVLAPAPAAGSGGRSAALSPPAIHETFTLLPCPAAATQGSTLDQEGCVEHQIVTGDRQVDALNRTIFTELGDNAARRRFTTGHAAWLVYRHAYCLSRSDTAEGGTLAGLIDARCSARISAQHITDLRDFLDDLDRN
jgi:uncharacterized protein YecT (DUF1311 family)